MSDYYDQYWREKDDDELPDLAYKWPKIEQLLQKRTQCKNVLDFGCGTGVLLEKARKVLRRAKFTGMDVSLEALGRAKKRLPGIRLLQIDVEKSSVKKTNKFDLVLACDVIEHVYNVTGVLTELYKQIKPGGELIVSTPYHGFIKNMAINLFWFDKIFDPEGPHIRFFTKKSLIKSLESTGFAIRSVDYFGRFWPLWRGIVVVAIKA